jgi:hypothetical protein
VGLQPIGTASALNTLYGLDKNGNYSTSFNDITSGSNNYFNAGLGYDLATGLGTPKAPAILSALSAPTFVQTAVGHDSLNNEVLFGISSGDHQVYFEDFNSNGVPTTGWQLAGSGPASQIAVGQNPQGNPVLFAISSANSSVYYVDFAYNTATSSEVPTHGYYSAGNGQETQIAVGKNPQGNPVLFAISGPDWLGTSPVVYVDFTFDAATLSEVPTHGYYLAGNGQETQIAVGESPQGNPVLFAISCPDWAGTSPVVYVDFTYDAATLSEAPTHGYYLAAPGQVSQIAVGQNTQGNPVLFGIMTDDPSGDNQYIGYVDFAFIPSETAEAPTNGYERAVY